MEYNGQILIDFLVDVVYTLSWEVFHCDRYTVGKSLCPDVLELFSMEYCNLNVGYNE